MTFGPGDLDELEAFLLGSVVVLPMRSLVEDEPLAGATYMRHDVDDLLIHSLAFARWEADRGYRATYFLLPSTDYWRKTAVVRDVAMAIQDLGHEVGLHNDAYHELAEKTSRPASVVEAALAKLRGQADLMRDWGVDVVGCADHGSGKPRNVDLWGLYGRRPEEAGFIYEAYLLQHAVGVRYISDNGGVWQAPLERDPTKPTVVLVHPQHWTLP